MNNKIKLPTLLLVAVTTIGFMIPQTATARDRHAQDRGSPPKFANYDRDRHHYRHQRQHKRHQRHQPVPRWYRRYQHNHRYGYKYRSWRKHPGLFVDRHALKHHYRRMERQHPNHRRSHRGYSDSSIHFRIDYRN